MPRMRLKRSWRGCAERTGARPLGSRRLRERGDLARAEARDARLGAHVRRHGSLCWAAARQLRQRPAVAREYVLAEDRARIVFTLKSPLAPGLPDPAVMLQSVESLALGFEIIDCPFPDWKFQPADFVAAFGLHRALVVGDPRRVDEANIESLDEQLPRFTVRLTRDGELVDEGSGRNSLRSPALCLGELASALSRRRVRSRLRRVTSSALVRSPSRSRLPWVRRGRRPSRVLTWSR